MGADGEEGGIVALGKKAVQRFDPGARLHLDTGFLDIFDFGIEYIPGEPVGRYPHPHHSSRLGQRLKDGGPVPLPGQIVGSRQTGRSGPHDGDTLPGGRYLTMMLPLPGGVVGDKALECPYGLGSIGYLGQLALDLAGAGTNVAADGRKGDALADDGQRFGILAGDDEAKIARHVDSRRTRFPAGCFRWFSVHAFFSSLYSFPSTREGWG